MPEDKLTKAERLRLEAFAQAVNSSFTIRTNGERPSLDDLFEHAKLIEKFLFEANPKLM